MHILQFLLVSVARSTEFSLNYLVTLNKQPHTHISKHKCSSFKHSRPLAHAHTSSEAMLRTGPTKPSKPERTNGTSPTGEPAEFRGITCNRREDVGGKVDLPEARKTRSHDSVSRAVLYVSETIRRKSPLQSF